MEDLERYLNDIVDPTINDFEAHPTSVRHAFLACVAVFHGIDYLAYPKKRPATLRQEFANRSPDFQLVDYVAHAFKHVSAGPRNDPHLTVSDVIARPPGVWGQMVWDLSRWDDPTGGVTLNEKRDTDLLEVVKRAAAFLRNDSIGKVAAP
jgi:hypothetical protein